MRFTLITRSNAEAYEGREMEFPTEAAAVEAAPAVMEATIDFRPLSAPAVSSAAIGIGRGSMWDDEGVDWLGEWERQEGEDEWTWTASPSSRPSRVRAS